MTFSQMEENVFCTNRADGGSAEVGGGGEKEEEGVVRSSAISPSILSCCLLITVTDTVTYRGRRLVR